MAQDVGHDKHDAAHDAHGHGAHGHAAGPLTRELSGTLGVVAAGSIAILGIAMNAIVGPILPAGHHGGDVELREWPPVPPGEADVIFTNVRVRQPGYADASYIAVRQGKILGIGGDELLARRTATTIVHDLHGGYAIPGLRDAHGHLALLGRKLNQRICDLTDVNDSVEDVVQAFETWMKIMKRNAKPGELLEGHGWDESKWKTAVMPSKEELLKAFDGKRDFTKEENQGYTYTRGGSVPDSTDLLDNIAPENPVVLLRTDGHMAWVNHKALEMAGLLGADVPNPPGGRILRDRNGEPTGILVDAAIGLVYQKMARKSDDQQILEAEEDFLAAAQACARAGLVEVHEAGVSLNEELALRALAKTGKLPIRVYAMITGNKQDLAERFMRAAPVKEAIGDRLTIRAVKLYADGAMGSHGALLLKPYSDEPAASGLPVLSRDEITQTARRCKELGWQLCVHAIGDAANREVLDIYEEVLGAEKDRRWRIEHAQLIDSKDMPRFAKLGVIASMQPTHATTDMRWALERLGAERLAGAYAWRSLLDTHAHLAFGSDFPVESERPALGLYAAVTRQDADGKPDGGFLPKQRLTPEEALGLFTEGAAYASFAEERRGKLVPGMDADITVWSEDPLELLAESPKKLLAAKVTGTFVGGKDALK